MLDHVIMFVFSLAAFLFQYLSASIALVTEKDVAQVLLNIYGNLSLVSLYLKTDI